MLKASGKKFDSTNCSSPQLAQRGVEVREHVSTCRTAEDKDRSRERAHVSRTRVEGRQEPRKERETRWISYGGKVAATAGRGGRDGGC